MEILVNLDVMMAKRKISAGELAERVGITPANLSILKNNKAKAIRFSTLMALCRELQCQPETFWNLWTAPRPLSKGESNMEKPERDAEQSTPQYSAPILPENAGEAYVAIPEPQPFTATPCGSGSLPY